jgi:hypothetical protein
MLIGAALALAGCATMATYWPLQSPLGTVPAPTPARPETTPTATQETPHSPSRNRTARRKPATAVATAPGAAAPAAASAPAAGETTVSLGDDDGNRLRAQSLLDETGAKLTSINRSQLTPEDAAAYDQASGLVDAARNAMRQQDYLAAAGLAEKASVISRQLATRAPLR